MTPDELKSCSGYTVEVLFDGKEEVAELHDADSERPFLTCGKTITPGIDPAEFTKADRYYLTKKDIAGLIPKGHRNLFSRITFNSPSKDSN
jgi:hypothetical protein